MIADLVNAAIYHGKCTTLEEIADTGEPVILSKVPYYRPTHEKEYDDVSNAFALAEYPFLTEATKDPMCPLRNFYLRSLVGSNHVLRVVRHHI